MHLHDETLTLLALGEEPTPEEREHLFSCVDCSGELESYRRVVSVGRSTAPGTGGANSSAPEDGAARNDSRAYPPPEVWAGIHSALGLSEAVRADPARTDPDAAPSRPQKDARIVSLAERRRRPAGRRWLAAAAASAVVAGAAVWGIVETLDQRTETLAAAELAPLPAYDETGRAEVDRLPDGRRELVVKASGTDAAGYREVWLLAPDASSMVSLGTMEGTEARFTLPSDLDLDAYPVVDISDEPFDGNPAHSGDSILRGQLEL